MDDFKAFATAVEDRFRAMSEFDMFTVDIDRDHIIETYLGAFPAGTNPIFRTNTVHDCSADKHFIRTLGKLVVIDNGVLCTVWDNLDVPAPYDTVSRVMRDLIVSRPIVGPFRTKFTSFGSRSNRELIDCEIVTFDHFFGQVGNRHMATEPATEISRQQQRFAVFKRGVTELTLEALTTVIQLIDDDMIYRGAEHRRVVVEFLELWHQYYGAITARLNGDHLLWLRVKNPAAQIRNTVIGSLLVDLSNGVNLTDAVKSFEAKVAPENYKRSKSLITPEMIERAIGDVRALGLEPALHRRHATLADMNVNDVLFVDASVQGQMVGGLEAALMSEAKVKAPKLDHATPVQADKFFNEILPGKTSLEVLVKSEHAGNFVSLTAPQTTDAAPLFKWDSGFAWSYDGNVTDSIKERVKRAGGDADARYRVSLSWFNSDDLDLHCEGPDGHIYFGNKAGVLDVDMNAGRINPTDPVENMRWQNMRDGKYTFYVNQFTKRTSERPGFEIEMEFDGTVHQMSYSKVVRGDIHVATITVKSGVVTKIEPSLKMETGLIQGEKWGVKTNALVPVHACMLSPNFWSGRDQGNKHWFFILKDCRNPEPVRGIYNEFLRDDLHEHRKVFEVLGDKTKCEPSNDQLSGVGFSSTQRASMKVVADGRAYEIQF